MTLNGAANLAIVSATEVAYTGVVEVTASSISSNQVTVSAVPPLLAPGATLLGKDGDGSCGKHHHLDRRSQCCGGQRDRQYEFFKQSHGRCRRGPGRSWGGFEAARPNRPCDQRHELSPLSGNANATTTVATAKPFTSPRPIRRACLLSRPSASQRCYSTFKVLRNIAVKNVAGTGSVTAGFPPLLTAKSAEPLPLTATPRGRPRV